MSLYTFVSVPCLCALFNKRLGGQSRDSTKFFTITTKTLRNEVEHSKHARRALPHLPRHHFCTSFEFMPYAAHPGWSVMLLSAKNNECVTFSGKRKKGGNDNKNDNIK